MEILSNDNLEMSEQQNGVSDMESFRNRKIYQKLNKILLLVILFLVLMFSFRVQPTVSYVTAASDVSVNKFAGDVAEPDIPEEKPEPITEEPIVNPPTEDNPNQNVNKDTETATDVEDSNYSVQKDKTVKTGDRNRVIFWLSIIIVCIFAVIIWFIFRFRKGGHRKS